LVCLFGGFELTESKNREKGGALALGDRLINKTHNNQIVVGIDVEWGVGETARLGGTCG
jgi:hypothetical protein